MYLDTPKGFYFSLVVVIGGFVTSAFGGWSLALTCVLWCMGVDFITAIVNAIFFKSSNKTASGTLSSSVFFVGLVKKMAMLSFIVLGHQIDIAYGMSYIKDALCLAITVGELTSIIENAKLMGIKVPKPLADVVDVLNSKQERE